jgi:hypothetical protein
METTPTAIVPTDDPSLPTVAYIDAVLDAWQADTAAMSSDADIMAHPAHAHLASFGEVVARRILERMEGQPDSSHPGWFSLLREITGKAPVPQEHSGDMVKMAEHWIEWGKRHANWLYVPFG